MVKYIRVYIYLATITTTLLKMEEKEKIRYLLDFVCRIVLECEDVEGEGGGSFMSPCLNKYEGLKV